MDNLKVMIAGKSSDDPGTLLRGQHFSQMRKRLQEITDIIVYDSPPLLLVSDPLLLAKYVDLTIIVTEAGSTKRESARRGAEAINKLNNSSAAAVPTKQRTGITGYNYDYGYSSYYGTNGAHGRRSAIIRKLHGIRSVIAFGETVTRRNLNGVRHFGRFAVNSRSTL